MNTHITLIIKSLPALLSGALVTIEIAFFASMIGFILGTIIGIMQHMGTDLFKRLITGYVALVRGTPMLIQITFMSIILPQFGISLFTTAILAIGFNSAAYISQIIRSGIAAVSIGQLEAAQVLGISRKDTIVKIVLPQAIRMVTPALLNEFITLIKDSSLASVIGVVELFKAGTVVISRTYNALAVYCAIALIYLLLTGTVTALVHFLEKKWKTYAID